MDHYLMRDQMPNIQPAYDMMELPELTKQCVDAAAIIGNRIYLGSAEFMNYSDTQLCNWAMGLMNAMPARIGDEPTGSMGSAKAQSAYAKLAANYIRLVAEIG